MTSENHRVSLPLWLSLVWAQRTVITEAGTIPALAGVLWLDVTRFTGFTKWKFEKGVAACLDLLDLIALFLLIAFQRLLQKVEEGQVHAASLAKITSKSLSRVSVGAECPKQSLGELQSLSVFLAQSLDGPGARDLGCVFSDGSQRPLSWL